MITLVKSVLLVVILGLLSISLSTVTEQLSTVIEQQSTIIEQQSTTRDNLQKVFYFIIIYPTNSFLNMIELLLLGNLIYQLAMTAFGLMIFSIYLHQSHRTPTSSYLNHFIYLLVVTVYQ